VHCTREVQPSQPPTQLPNPYIAGRKRAQRAAPLHQQPASWAGWHHPRPNSQAQPPLKNTVCITTALATSARPIRCLRHCDMPQQPQPAAPPPSPPPSPPPPPLGGTPSPRPRPLVLHQVQAVPARCVHHTPHSQGAPGRPAQHQRKPTPQQKQTADGDDDDEVVTMRSYLWQGDACDGIHASRTRNST
jgi:hypothetical protein